MPRALDHFVFPVLELDDARRRYQAMGFTVAANARHPFGTENCCVFFADGTFIEPLAIGQRETCEAAAIKGNQFVRNDQTYRFRVGREGFSQLVIKTADAKADHKVWTKSGMSGGKVLDFGRKFVKPDGEIGEVAFRLAFAADQRSPDAGFFSCEVVKSVPGGRGKLVEHANGTIGIKRVLMAEANPTDFQYFLQEFLDNRETEADSFGMSIRAENADIEVLTPEGLLMRYGLKTRTADRGMELIGLVLATRDLGGLEARLADAGIEAFKRANSLIVPAGAGQGGALVFEAV